MSVTLHEWIRARRPAPPDQLLEALLTRVPDGDANWKSLADAGIEALKTAVPMADRRAGAIELLVADALLTYAMECAAEESVDAVRKFSAFLDTSRLEELLSGATDAADSH